MSFTKFNKTLIENNIELSYYDYINKINDNYFKLEIIYHLNDYIKLDMYIPDYFLDLCEVIEPPYTIEKIENILNYIIKISPYNYITDIIKLQNKNDIAFYNIYNYKLSSLFIIRPATFIFILMTYNNKYLNYEIFMLKSNYEYSKYKKVIDDKKVILNK